MTRRGEAVSLKLWKPLLDIMQLHFGFQQDVREFWRRSSDCWEPLSGYRSQKAAFDYNVSVKTFGRLEILRIVKKAYWPGCFFKPNFAGHTTKLI